MGMLQLRDKFQNVGFSKFLHTVRLKKILKYAVGNKCIELGCGEGQITKHLVKRYDYLVAVDKNKTYLDRVHHTIHKIHSKIEDLSTLIISYDYIVCSNVLEHVDHPEVLVKTIKSFGHKDSVFFFSVPNANSFNRLLGVDLGMLDKSTSLGDCDKEAGHKRMFTVETFIDLFNKDYEIKDYGTYFYKPFNNEKMRKLPRKFLKICEAYKMQEYGAEIFVVARKK